jgi:hypothetical protein
MYISRATAMALIAAVSSLCNCVGRPASVSTVCRVATSSMTDGAVITTVTNFAVVSSHTYALYRNYSPEHFTANPSEGPSKRYDYDYVADRHRGHR